jgi:outer membrane immunogenic protein
MNFRKGLLLGAAPSLVVACLAAAGLSVGLTAVATAADLSRPAPAPVYAKAPPISPVYSWSGFYIGANAGHTWGDSQSSTDVASGVPGSFFEVCGPPANGCVINTIDVHNAGRQRTSTSGFVGGAQAGYNWQTGNLVLGVEADFDYFNNKGTSSRTVALVAGPPGSVTVNSSITTDWLFTLRPRLGWALDNWLIYGTGGLAVSELKPSWTFFESEFNSSASSSFNNTKVGWTVGAGVETLLPGKWILGAEYLFVRFDSASQTVPVVVLSGAPQNFFHSADLDSNIMRARVSKQF